MGNAIKIPKYRMGQEVFLVDIKVGIAKAVVVDFARTKDGEARYILDKKYLISDKDNIILYVGLRKSRNMRVGDVILRTTPAPESLLFVEGDSLSKPLLFLDNPLIPKKMQEVVFSSQYANDVRDGYRVVFDGVGLVTLGKTK